MSTSDWPSAAPTLEHHYRRLLNAYPSHYRRRHGAEIVTTLLEMAEPGQQRPRLADSWHLIASGLRQRLRLPRRPLAMLGAALALLAGAAFGAAAGSWAAFQTYTPLPSHDQATAVHRLTAGVPGAAPYVRTLRGFYDTGPMVMADSNLSGWQAAPARARLAADGWQNLPVAPPDRGYELLMRRDGLRIHAVTDVTRSTVWSTVSAVDNGWMRPLVVAGLLAGALTGWLIATTVAQRRSRPAAVTTVFAVAALTLPVVSIADNLTNIFHRAHQGATVHHVLITSSYWPSGPLWLNPALTVAGLALTVVTVLVSRLSRPSGPSMREVAL
ncbi:hypothetical protein GCM10010112_70490 [Actinoplanes lobatus]|uniref:Uncharacterized protein n=1 Tax=Actinoplanes lobatus TaxID=113568 RepID=A0A7W7MJV4_9ACTN|nr:hypothetical protein [Actinoplanes lobatus]MBB4752974.1 hypothetical protein [Actinoplanes lobatus]GGN87618.1 hypothetical protein GCM10010112_70490 [Actinoplanes lobatus]GIE39581.1 hypothetical protein Alo02nite_24790 [Actinoplanes lobatus]